MSTARGQAAEFLCAARVLDAGWQWGWPPEGLPYDGLICYNQTDPTTWWRVQVKRIFVWKDHGPCVNVCRSRDRKYTMTDADYLAAVDMEAGFVYLIPWDEVYNQTRLVINDERHGRYII